MRKDLESCFRKSKLLKSEKDFSSNDRLFNIALYNKLQNDIAQEDRGLRKGNHFLRRTREGLSNVLLTKTRTKKLNQNLTEELSILKNLTNEFQGVEKEGKHTTEESKTKLLIEVKMFE